MRDIKNTSLNILFLIFIEICIFPRTVHVIVLIWEKSKIWFGHNDDSNMPQDILLLMHKIKKTMEKLCNVWPVQFTWSIHITHFNTPILFYFVLCVLRFISKPERLIAELIFGMVMAFEVLINGGTKMPENFCYL